MTASGRTIGHYLREPGNAERIATRRAAARWRFRRGLADARTRADIARLLMGLVEGVNRGRRLDAIGRDLIDAGRRCLREQRAIDADLEQATSADENEAA